MDAVDDGCWSHVALVISDDGCDVGWDEILDEELGCGGVDIVAASKQLLDVDVEDACDPTDSVESNVGGGISSFDAWNAREVVEQDSGVWFSCCIG